MKPGRIRITCKGASSLPLDDLIEFQGELKRLSDEDYGKLKNTIIEEGFSFPFFIWKNKGQNYMIDGHQRKIALLKMVQEGWKIEKPGKLPVVWVEAKNEKEAKKKVLLAMSQYGKYTEKSFMEFVEESGLDLEGLSLTIDIPTIDVDSLLGGGKKKKGEERPEIEFTEELMESHNYVVLYFENDVDWLQAQTLFGLKTVKALDSKKGFEKCGIGRVLRGPEAIERIRGGHI